MHNSIFILNLFLLKRFKIKISGSKTTVQFLLMINLKNLSLIKISGSKIINKFKF
jgi:hypothetical protein